jgi:hypothetical protein
VFVTSILLHCTIGVQPPATKVVLVSKAGVLFAWPWEKGFTVAANLAQSKANQWR